MTTYTIDHPDYGERVSFPTLAAAQQAIDAIGYDEPTILCEDGTSIYDERGLRIGTVQAGEPCEWGASNYRTGACDCGPEAWLERESGGWGRDYAYLPDDEEGA